MDKQLVKMFFVGIAALMLFAGTASAEEKVWSWNTLNALPTDRVAPYAKGGQVAMCDAFGRKPRCVVTTPDKPPAYGCFSVVAPDGTLWGDMYAIQEAYPDLYVVADKPGQQVCNGHVIDGPNHPALVRRQ